MVAGVRLVRGDNGVLFSGHHRGSGHAGRDRVDTAHRVASTALRSDNDVVGEHCIPAATRIEPDELAGAADQRPVSGSVLLAELGSYLVAIVVPLAIIAITFRRDLGVRFTTNAGTAPSDRAFFVVAIVVLIALLPALVSGIPVWIPASIAAFILVVAFVLRSPSVLRIGMVPWSLLVFAAGLFVVIDSAHQLGLGAILTAVSGEGTGFGSLLHLAGVGAASSNLVNNLPAYVALEPSTLGHPLRIMALLIGTNCGPLITPWASLATLLWHDRLNAMGVRVPWGRYALLGTIAAPLTVVGSVTALSLIG